MSQPTSSSPKLLVLGVSRDRPLQLDAMLRSFRARCRDASSASVAVVCRSSTAAHQIAYRELSADFPDVTLIAERDFKRQVEDLLAVAHAVLLVGDEAVFVRDFDLAPLVAAMAEDPQIGCAALRLGRNIRAQVAPAFAPTNAAGVSCYRWPAAEGDFGRPFATGATLFAASDLLTLLRPATYDSLRTLDDALTNAREELVGARPAALCFDSSVAITIAMERAGMSNEGLLERYIRGERMDVAALAGIVPVAAEQELLPPMLPAPGAPVAAPAPPAPIARTSNEPYEPVLRQLETLLGAGNFQAAYGAVNAYLDRNTGHAAATMDLATLLAQTGHLDAAQATLEPLIEREPEHADARRKLAAVLLARGDANGAVAVVHPLMRTDPKNPETLVLFGEAAVALGVHDKALTFLRAAAANGAPGEALKRKITELEAIAARPHAPATAMAR